MAQITLRPATPEDNPFYLRVYASTRTDEMALVNWSAEQKETFLQMQFQAQAEHYRFHYPQAEYQIIQRDGNPIGRLILDRSSNQLLIMDIALLPEYRNAGVGTALIQDLMAEATRSSLPVVLHVEFFNPVIHLYTRLGFIKTREVNTVYHEMVWTPAACQA